MTKTPVPGPDRERCFQDSECAHGDPKSEFAYPVTRPVITRSKADANASPQKHVEQDDGPDKPLK